jgi:hypothetical protein
MNDNELITLAREPFDGVRMTMPLDAVVRHGRALRRRRRLRGLTGAVALAGGLAAAVALLVPGGQAGPARPAQTGTARLAAWTVASDPDGGITVTVNQMKDPAGLQARLRADGVPARVTFDPRHWVTQPLPAGCTAPKMSDRANAQIQDKILTPPAVWAYQQQVRARPWLYAKKTWRLHGHVVYWYILPSSLQKVEEQEEQDAAGRSALYINPAAIPAGIGLSIGVDVASPSNFGYGVDLVVTSPQCTGSLQCSGMPWPD